MEKIKEKSTFLNLDMESSIRWKFFFIHVGFIFIWVFGLWLVLFRGDYSLLRIIPESYDWVFYLTPIVFLFGVMTLMFYIKWYYSLILVFYPILLIFWFLPKIILKRGKIYLLSGYANFLFERIKKYKSTIIHLFFIVISVLLFVASGSVLVRVFGMAFFTYLYFKILWKYIKKTLKPIDLFGHNVEEIFNLIKNNPQKTQRVIIALEQGKPNKGKKKVDLNKRIKRLVSFNLIIEHFIDQIKSFKGKKAFVIYWVYQLAGFVVLL